ncbi:MAG: L-rhamnose isomerase [Firmicutes bacterium]|nr:L-rhamnose isomerase [Bacillota bacterium]MDY2808281.1 L-rhamnose isomerase [Oscillospiraceae bacterium]
MKEELILKGYEYAKAQYAAQGVDVDAAIAKADAIPVSMHCWQGDDVIGFDGSDSLSGGIQTTGNYPGRARTADELRADIAFVRTMIPGATKLNLHASYAEKNGKQVDRDAYTIDLFQNWVDFAKEQKIGLDFNPTYFAHPKMDGDFSLSSTNPAIRKFWIEHGKRCREIGLEFAKQLNQPCAINFWMPDGYKDVCADTKLHRDLMIDSLDQIFAEDIDRKLVPCGLESKLFGVGVESYTVASHEFSYGYAVKNGLLYTLDAGHFHPTEVISAKLTACLPFLEGIILHVSRPVRWDSDHVILLDDEIQRIMDEIILNNYQDRTFIALDYFDASINRVAAWAVGMRNARKAILSACLAPASIRDAEHKGDLTSRLALMEERKTLPFGAIWDYYCMKQDAGVSTDWLAKVKRYETDVLSKR